uniref:ABC transporter ATP-binding protein n=1 Tax=Candidatus Mycoplasma mahonii TaxID=3004105 RepID=UPI00357165C5
MYKNKVYKNLKKKVKELKNSNYNEISNLKIELNLLRNVDSNLIDEFKRAQRLLKVAKINNAQKEISKYDKQCKTMKLKIDAGKNDLEKKHKIRQLKIKIKELKKSKTSSDRKTIMIAVAKKLESAVIWKKYIPQKVEDVTSMLGINMYLKRKPADLSGGQRQRVALARAISKKTGLFLFDEPLSNLDSKLRSKMRTEIRDIHEKLSSTSIYVTHDQIEAMSMADKIVVMNKGYIQQVGTPLQLLENPNNLFVAKFIGNTEINILNIKYKSSNNFISDKKGEISITKFNHKNNDIKNNARIVAGIRPEHIIVDPQIVRNFKMNKFEGEIVKIEILGNEVLLTVDSKTLGIIRLISTVAYSHKRGEKIKFVINPNKIHIYDNKTGYNLLKNFDAENDRARDVWIKGEEERKKNIYLMTKEKGHVSSVMLLGLYITSLYSSTSREILKTRKEKIDYGDQLKAS